MSSGVGWKLSVVAGASRIEAVSINYEIDVVVDVSVVLSGRMTAACRSDGQAESGDREGESPVCSIEGTQ